ncbi:GNAT family N-acetyltransferase [Paenibacillus montanisoli]|uniref:N-acetyltransferase n=1 Tax=Paenibacillus montanisoli TaxID=2081970 RepID=A0A328U4Z6_9BACL|nr:GNAT family protein [Paenibacillus montanisoli]RAP76005.1 N-acetyltransferase [Paenibacillus montanisoli]
MQSYLWAGCKIRLRPAHRSDWALFHANDFDSESARLCDVIYFPRSEDGTQAWAEGQAERPTDGDNVWLAIETLDGELAGSICTNGCNPRSGTFKYGVAVFREHWRKGFASEAVRIILRYYFEELRYNKANAHVYSFNEGSAALQERLGFKQEGHLRDMIFTKGRHYDELVYGMTKSDYDRLKEEKPLG